MEKCEFHKEIGCKLEGYARECGESRNRCNSTGNACGRIEIKADDIDCGGFVPAMLLVLSMNNSLTKDFIEESKPYIGLTYNEIDPNKAEELLKKFEASLG